MGRPKLDLIGLRSGKLLVIELVPTEPKRGEYAKWKCLCDCGNYIVTTSKRLRNGRKATSCGCWSVQKRVDQVKTHGLSNTKTYWTWQNMKRRCADPDHPSWSNYGGRGITVCDRWLESVDNFIEDMGWRPDGMVLDRIDNDKGYYKENCQWITSVQNNRKKRNTIMIEHNGKNLALSEWADIVGLRYMTLRTRIFVLKWPIEKALLQPLATV